MAIYCLKQEIASTTFFSGGNMRASIVKDLSNFNIDLKLDRIIYEFFDEKFQAESLIKSYKSLLGDIPQEEKGEHNLLSLCVGNAIKRIELRIIALSLDLKLSLLAKYTQEPYQGFFGQIGVTNNHKHRYPIMTEILNILNER